MNNSNTAEIGARASEIIEQIKGLGPMVNGLLLVKHNRSARKDGTTHVSPAHYVLQYRGADGKRKWANVPARSRKAVERMAEAGKLYRRLEAEYCALATEAALAGCGKKNA